MVNRQITPQELAKLQTQASNFQPHRVLTAAEQKAMKEDKELMLKLECARLVSGELAKAKTLYAWVSEVSK